MNTDQYLQTIRDELDRAAQRLADFCVEMEQLEQARRAASISMCFAAETGAARGYSGCAWPGVAVPQDLTRNRERWKQLDRAAQELDDWLYARECELQSMARRCCTWPGAEVK